MADVRPIRELAPNGGPEAAEDLARRMYEELRELARRELADERANHTLQPTALVHEAYLRLVGPAGGEATFENRAHFFGAAANAVRRVLVDHARRRASAKRGARWRRRTLSEHEPAAPEEEHWLALDAALQRLDKLSPRKAKIVEMRFFGGMTHAELARVLSVSEPTVRREWRVARAWLRDELGEEDGR